ncbi:predicted protein [Postia placenta Mad-698-R]|nr:predicted protein [Postia placenta Mad-698-R]
MCGFLGKGFMVPFAGVAVDNGRDGDRVAGREFEVDARSLSGSRLEWRACMVTEAPLKGMGSWLAAASRERDRLFLERERADAREKDAGIPLHWFYIQVDRVWMRAIGILWVNESLVLGLFRLYTEQPRMSAFVKEGSVVRNVKADLFGRDGMDALQLARGADESAKLRAEPLTSLDNLTRAASIKPKLPSARSCFAFRADARTMCERESSSEVEGVEGSGDDSLECIIEITDVDL